MIKRLPLLSIATTIVAVACATAPTVPPELSPSEKDALVHFEQAQQALARGQYENALASFEATASRQWTPMVAYGEAQAMDGLNRPVTACARWTTLRDSGDLTAYASITDTIRRASKRCDEQGLGISSPLLGAASAPVTLTLAVDLDGRPTVPLSTLLKRAKDIQDRHQTQVRVRWMNSFASYHAHAQPAALAAMAAHRQGKFWPYIKAIANDGVRPTEDRLVAWATAVGLDIPQWENDRASARLRKALQREQRLQAFLDAPRQPQTVWFNAEPDSWKMLQDDRTLHTAINDTIEAMKKAVQFGVPIHRVRAHVANRTKGVPSSTEAALKPYVQYVIEGQPLPAVQPDLQAIKEAPLCQPPKGLIWRVPVSPQDAQWGPSDAPVTIVEFSDFQCPYCTRGSQTMVDVKRLYGDHVRVVFKHQPLNFHTQARPAAIAAMAAQKQGRFWEMHDHLFEQGSHLSDDSYPALAKALRLDVDAFERDRADEDQTLEKRVRADQALAKNVSAQGTPTFFVNGQKVSGAQPLKNFRPYIEAHWALAECAKSRGLPAEEYYARVIQNGKTWTPFEEKVQTFTLTDRPSLGPVDAPVTIVEYSDYQCPYCSRMSNLLHALMERMPDQIRWVSKQFPLNFHAQAHPAAAAALAAHQQGQYWPMHDALFAQQRALGEERYETLAKKLKLDRPQFDRVRKGKGVVALINQDMQEARAAGLRGTPTLFINGRRYAGRATSAALLQRDIEQYILKGGK